MSTTEIAMPTMIVEFPDCAKNIGRPVVFEVIRQLAMENGLPDNLQIRYMGQNQALPLAGSTLNDQGAQPRFPGVENITIDVTEDYDADRVSNTFVNYPDQPPFFADKDLDVYIRPIYQRVKVTVNVKYVATDKTTAEAWVRTMKRRCTQQVTMFPHHIDYHYPVPPQMLQLLFAIHTNREAVAGLGEDRGTWFKRCFIPRMTVLRDQDGGNPTFAIAERQVRLLGNYDFGAEVAKSEKDGDVGNWSISFNYVFSYDRAESAIVKYPIVIHNAVLPRRWLFMEQVYDPARFYSQGGMQMDLLTNYFTYSERLGKLPPPGLSVPYFDTWVQPNLRPKHLSLLRILSAVNLSNPKEVVNLTNLNNWRFRQEAIPYMQDIPIAMTQPGESVFVLQFFQGDKELPPTYLIVAQDLGINWMFNLDPAQTYRLCVSMLCDPTQLSQAALKRLAKHGKFFLLWLVTIYPGLRGAALPSLNPDGSVSLTALLKVLTTQTRGRIIPGNSNMARMFDYTKSSLVNFTNDQVAWPMVGQFMVQTSKR